MKSFKLIPLTALCALTLAGCAATDAPSSTKVQGGPPPVSHPNPDVDVYVPDVVYPPQANAPESQPASGFAVFDNGVTVYPLPGENVPAFVPDYAVPPLEDQYKTAGQECPPQTSTVPPVESTLPPVPSVDLGVQSDPYASRTPLALDAPQPLTMQPPSGARPPLPSPFDKAQPVVDEPVRPAMAMPDDTTLAEADKALQDLVQNPTAALEPPVAPAPAVVTPPYPSPDKPTGSISSITTPGRRSAPLLTGY